jgi:NADH-quinone oxidoreductase subunit L
MQPSLLWLIPTLPFAGFLLNGTLGRKLPRAAVAAIALLFTAAPAAIVAWLWVYLKSAGAPESISVVSQAWIKVTGFEVNFAFTVDHLTVVMLSIITGVGYPSVFSWIHGP